MAERGVIKRSRLPLKGGQEGNSAGVPWWKSWVVVTLLWSRQKIWAGRRTTHPFQHKQMHTHTHTFSLSSLKPAAHHSALHTHTCTVSQCTGWDLQPYLKKKKVLVHNTWQGESQPKNFYCISFPRTRRQAVASRRSFRLQQFYLFWESIATFYKHRVGAGGDNTGRRWLSYSSL